MKKIITTLILLLTAHSAKAAGKTAGPDLGMHAKLMNGFETYSELIDGYTTMGFISVGDRDDILRFFSKHKLELANAPTSAAVNGSKLTWGKISVTVLENGAYKTHLGYVFRPAEGRSMFERLNQVHAALSRKSLASLYLMLPAANAAETLDTSNVVSTATLETVLVDRSLAATYLKALGALGAPYKVLGDGVASLALFLNDILKKSDVGVVRCAPDKRYVMTVGMKPQDFKAIEEETKKTCQKDLGNLGPLAVQKCAFIDASVKYFKTSYQLTENEVYFAPQKLQTIFEESEIPACDESSAQQVQAALGPEIEKLFAVSGPSEDQSGQKQNRTLK